MKWKLTGTATQQAIVQDALNKIKFPWDRLNITWSPELGWRDLNSGFYLESEEPPQASIGDGIVKTAVGALVDTVKSVLPRGHEGHFTPENEGKPEPLNGKLQGRKFTMGVFYPGSGKIFIDYRLEKYPAMAQATLAAEVAHAVDEFLPLTDEQRNALIEALGGKLGEMTWWEKQDYSTEYWTLAGEHFMALFTNAYSDIPFGDTSDFQLNPNNVPTNKVVQIVGIKRTDYVPETPPPPPPPAPVLEPAEVLKPVPAPVPAPVPTPEPAPAAPVPHTHEYKQIGKSKTLHKTTHYPTKPGKIITGAHLPTGFTACKICKPH